MLLEECTKNNTKSLNDLIKPGTYRAKVLDVYDGDTIWVAYNNESIGLIKSKVRLNRINAAEIRGNKNESELQKQARVKSAKRAKDIVSQLVNGKIVTLVITKLDLYSRILGDIIIDREDFQQVVNDGGTGNVDLSTFMLQGGYAEEYEG